MKTTYDYWVIASHAMYSSISMYGEYVYDTEAEAIASASQANDAVPKGSSIKYTVMTLDNYLSEVRDDARNDGYYQGRDSVVCDCE